jgi:hypothetical protein
LRLLGSSHLFSMFIGGHGGLCFVHVDLRYPRKPITQFAVRPPYINKIDLERIDRVVYCRSTELCIYYTSIAVRDNRRSKAVSETAIASGGLGSSDSGSVVQNSLAHHSCRNGIAIRIP